jgi:hypothetical protein
MVGKTPPPRLGGFSVLQSRVRYELPALSIRRVIGDEFFLGNEWSSIIREHSEKMPVLRCSLASRHTRRALSAVPD